MKTWKHTGIGLLLFLLVTLASGHGGGPMFFLIPISVFAWSDIPALVRVLVAVAVPGLLAALLALFVGPEQPTWLLRLAVLAQVLLSLAVVGAIAISDYPLVTIGSCIPFAVNVFFFARAAEDLRDARTA